MCGRLTQRKHCKAHKATLLTSQLVKHQVLDTKMLKQCCKPQFFKTAHNATNLVVTLPVRNEVNQHLRLWYDTLHNWDSEQCYILAFSAKLWKRMLPFYFLGEKGRITTSSILKSVISMWHLHHLQQIPITKLNILKKKVYWKQYMYKIHSNISINKWKTS